MSPKTHILLKLSQITGKFQHQTDPNYIAH